jgi:hypothetical protein
MRKNQREFQGLGKLGHSMLWKNASLKALVERSVFGFGLFQNGNVGIRILPQSEKVMVGGARFGLVAGE